LVYRFLLWFFNCLGYRFHSLWFPKSGFPFFAAFSRFFDSVFQMVFLSLVSNLPHFPTFHSWAIYSLFSLGSSSAAFLFIYLRQSKGFAAPDCSSGAFGASTSRYPLIAPFGLAVLTFQF